MRPERIGKYELRGTLGRGAMGTVYDGWDPAIGRRVAIKTVRLADAAADAEAAQGLERFRREAQAAGRLSHPNIVGVFDTGETDELAYIVMEFIEGTSLKDVLDAEKSLAPARVAEIMGQALAGLAYSHKRGVVHRDIKPANVMLTPEGQVKLADFGIARIASSQATAVGVIMGTPAYMPPEQFLGDPADARSDIYAAGAMLFHLLTGARPYEGNPTSIMQRVLNAAAPPLPSARSTGVSAAWDRVIARAMARRAEDRYQSAEEFAAAVREAATAAAFSADETMLLGPGAAAGLAASDATVHSVVPVRSAVPPRSFWTRYGTAIGGGGAGLVVALLAAWFVMRPAALPVATISKPDAPAPGPVSAAPAPVPSPAPRPLSTAERAAALQGVIAGKTCARVEVTTEGDAVAMRGIAGSTALATTLTAAAAQAGPLVNEVQPFPDSYCDLVAVVAPIAAANRLPLVLPEAPDHLHAGEFMHPTIERMPFDGWLTVDFLDSSGGVSHLAPHGPIPVINSAGKTVNFPAYLAGPFAAGTKVVLGHKPDVRRTVSQPFGPDMIIAIASARPLIPVRPNATENTADYVTQLRAALEKQRAAGGQLAADAIVFVTMDKPLTQK